MTTRAILSVAVASLALAPLQAVARDGGVETGAVVQSVDAGSLSVKFNGGTTYRFAPASLLTQLQRGAAVNIFWQDINGDRVITRVSPAR